MNCDLPNIKPLKKMSKILDHWIRELLPESVSEAAAVLATAAVSNPEAKLATATTTGIANAKLSHLDSPASVRIPLNSIAAATVKDLSLDFSTGYYFGMVLGALGLLPSCTIDGGSKIKDHGFHYSSPPTSSSTIKNFILLQSHLHSTLNINLTPTNALEIIGGDRGAILGLLREIKVRSDEKLKSKNYVGTAAAAAVAAKKKESLLAPTAEKKVAVVFDSYPSSPLSSQPNISAKEESPLPSPTLVLTGPTPLETQTASHFARILKSKLKRSIEFDYMKGREDLMPSQYAELPASRKKVLPSVSLAGKVKTSFSPQPGDISSPKSSKIQQRTYEEWNEEEEEEMSSPQRPGAPIPATAPIAPIPKTKIPKIMAAAAELSKNISKFEEKWQSSNPAEEKAGPSTSTSFSRNPETPMSLTLNENDKTFLASRAHLDPILHLSHLRDVYAHSSLSPNNNIQATRIYLDRIATQKAEEAALQASSALRQKKILVTQSALDATSTLQAAQDHTLSKLSRLSKQERRIAQQLLQIRQEKEVMRENRIVREEQYTLEREAAYRLSLDREAAQYKYAEGEYRDQVGMQVAQHMEILARREELIHEANTKWVHNTLTLPIVDMTMRIINYKEIDDKPEALGRRVSEWRRLVIEGMSVLEHDEIGMEKNGIIGIVGNGEILNSTDADGKPTTSASATSSSVSIPESVKLLDSDEFHEYLSYTGRWPSSGEGLIKNHDNLAQLIDHLITLTHTSSKKESVAAAVVPSVPLRVALIGKKYSGKRSVGAALAKKYNMSILNLDDLIKESIACADVAISKAPTGKKGGSAAGSEKESKKNAASNTAGVPLTKSQLGAKLQLSLLEGQSPDDSILVQLVVDAMSVEPVNTGGWLLIDFPRTKQQAQLLEKELSGYEDPKPSKKGELKRSAGPPSSSKAPNSGGNNRNRSLIASTENPSALDNNGSPQSTFDAFFLLDCKNEICFKRASGQLIDPITGKEYHIEYKPPPTTTPGLMERLATVEDPARAIAQLQYHLAAFDEEKEGLKDWLSQFKKLNIIDANHSPLDTENKVTCYLNDIIGVINKQQQELKGEEGTIGEEISSSSRSLSATIQQPKNSLHAGSVILEVPAKDTEPKIKLPSKELAPILMDQWVAIETSYTETVKFNFRSFRRLHLENIHYFYNTKMNFQSFLKRPDIEQDLIDTFQKEFNAVEDDFRLDGEVKAELHLRVEELRDKLWDVADRRRDEAEAERITIIDDRWIEDQSYLMINLLVTLIQAEADRYLQTRQFIIDFQKDAHGIAVTDSTKVAVKIPFIPLTAAPPIEIGSALIAASEAAATARKDAMKEISKQNEPAVKEKKDKKKAVPAEKETDKKPSKQEAKAAANAAAVADKEILAFDKENINFPDITATIEYLYGILASPEYTLKEPAPVEPSKDPKKGGPVEPKIDEIEKLPPDALPYIEVEELMLRQRCERMRQRAPQVFKALRNRSAEVFVLLDEWIGLRYKAEVEAARDLTTLVKEAIEAEQKLLNRIVLEGDKLFLDYATLVLEPPPEPRPESPIEKQSGENFSVSQLRVLAKDLRQIAPTGVISNKALLEFLNRAVIFSASNDALPDAYVCADTAQLQSIIAALDPFDSGFIGWRKYWMNLARILPVDISHLNDLKTQFANITGPITREIFSGITLWFETETLDFTQFNRPKKIKDALFDVFIKSAPLSTRTPKPATPEVINTTVPEDYVQSVGELPPIEEFDVFDFLLTSCCDYSPITSIEKAFAMLQDSKQTCSMSEVHSIFTHFLHLTRSTFRLDAAGDIDSPYPLSSLRKVFECVGGAGGKLVERVTWPQFVAACNASGESHWLTCKLYPIEDLSLNGTSRPSSGKPKI